MKKISIKVLLPFIAVLLIVLTLILSPAVLATAATSGDIQHIYDDAGLLSESELSDLENMCAEYSDKDDIDIVILTHDDSSAVDGEIYIENFVDNMQYLDSVVLLVDMYNRDVIVQGYGIAESKVNSDNATTLANDLSSYLSNEDYVTAFEKYIKRSDKYMNYDPLYLNPFIQLLAAFIIGAVSVGVMAYNAGGKMTVGGDTYMDSNHSGLIGRRDDYIRTQVTRVKKPQNNGSGGGGISAGGLSHSSGRAKF